MVRAPARPTTETSAPPYHTPGDGPRMSYEEYLAWHDHEGNAGEWVAGEVIPFVPPGVRHQDIVGFLYILVKFYVDRGRLGRVFFAPFEMRLTDLNRSREPDLLFIAAEHFERLSPQRLSGPADLAVEVVSASSPIRDRRDKLAEYAAVGVSEYWIVDSREGREECALYTLTDEGYYAPIRLGKNGRFASTVLAGLEIDPAWLLQDPLPDVTELLAALPGPASAKRKRAR